MSVPTKFTLTFPFLLLGGCAITPPPSEVESPYTNRYQERFAGENMLQSQQYLSSNEYVVQPGDNLYRIAKLHGCNYKQLADCNGLQQSRWDGSNVVYDIKPGQRLQLCVPCK